MSLAERDKTERKRKRMFVTVDESLDGGVKQRVMVVWHKGEPMMVCRWTHTCSGCTEYVEGQLAYGPSGCSECGYTGKRRNASLVPLPEDARKEAFRKRAARAVTR